MRSISLSLLAIGATVCGSSLALAQEKTTVPSVYVAAVRGECQGDKSFALINGRMATIPNMQSGRPDPQAGAPGTKQTLLTRFSDYYAVRTEITNELKKSRTVRVVERAEESNVVLHFCSVYWADTMTSRLSLGGRQIPDLYRIGAVALALPSTQFSPGADAYEKAKAASIWKVDTMEQHSLQFQAGPQAGFRVISSGQFKEMISAAEIAKAFVKEAERIGRQVGPPFKDSRDVSTPRPSLTRSQGIAPVTQPDATGEARTDDDNKVRIDTSLVVVPVSVMDRTGKYVPGLKGGDFSLYEDGIKQEISDFGDTATPFHVALLLDMSGSTRYRVDDIQDAALAFVEQLRPQDQVMVIAFDSLVRVSSEFTSDRKQLTRAILRTRTGGSTRAYDALDLVLTERLEAIKGRKAIVIFSDGVDTASTLADKEDVMVHVEESGTLVYSIRFETLADIGSAINRSPQQVRMPERVKEMYLSASGFLKSLAERSGGRFYDVADIKDTNEAFGNIAEELRRQYWLGYYPTNQAPDGTFRKIRVSVAKPEVAVRAREGYRAKQ